MERRLVVHPPGHLVGAVLLVDPAPLVVVRIVVAVSVAECRRSPVVTVPEVDGNSAGRAFGHFGLGPGEGVVVGLHLFGGQGPA